MAYSLLDYAKFLADKAQNKQLITFQEFADQFEIATIRSTTAPLNKVLKWTKSKDLPPLNALVVKLEEDKATAVIEDSESKQVLDTVFEYPWRTIFLNLPKIDSQAET